MRKHLTESVPMPRWWIYLVFLGFALDYIADETGWASSSTSPSSLSATGSSAG
jgi:hypothetical protein